MRSQRHLRKREGIDSDDFDGGPLLKPRFLGLGPTSLALVHPVTEQIGVLIYDASNDPLVGVTIVATSMDTGVATAAVVGVSDGIGECLIDVTSVASGECNILLTYLTASRKIVPVTVTIP